MQSDQPDPAVPGTLGHTILWQGRGWQAERETKGEGRGGQASLLLTPTPQQEELQRARDVVRQQKESAEATLQEQTDKVGPCSVDCGMKSVGQQGPGNHGAEMA